VKWGEMGGIKIERIDTYPYAVYITHLWLKLRHINYETTDIIQV